MAKLYIYHSPSEIGDDSESGALQIKIDDKQNLYYQVKKHRHVAIELENGVHEVKLYIPRPGGATCGYIVQTVQMQDEDLFYNYKQPFWFPSKGKFVKVNGAGGFMRLQRWGKVKPIITMFFFILALIALSMFVDTRKY